MREPGEIAAALPRPGRALKAVLALLAIFAIAGAILENWVPGGDRILVWLAFAPSELLHRPWTLFTSGLLTSGMSHALYSLIGLYFLTPDLEKRWGGARLIRFLLLSVLFGNLAVLAASYAPFQAPIFHPPLTFGPLVTVTATAIAWSKENAHRQIRFMFFIPMSGRTLFWLTIGIAFMTILFAANAPEGVFGPLGGCVAGMLFGGTPSVARGAWLRLKLAFLRRGGGGNVSVESILEPPSRPRATTKRKGGPPLRVVPGGLEDELKNRKPPKDKRYLN